MNYRRLLACAIVAAAAALAFWWWKPTPKQKAIASLLPGMISDYQPLFKQLQLDDRQTKAVALMLAEEEWANEAAAHSILGSYTVLIEYIPNPNPGGGMTSVTRYPPNFDQPRVLRQQAEIKAPFETKIANFLGEAKTAVYRRYQESSLFRFRVVNELNGRLESAKLDPLTDSQTEQLLSLLVTENTPHRLNSVNFITAKVIKGAQNFLSLNQLSVLRQIEKIDQEMDAAGDAALAAGEGVPYRR